MTSKRVTLLDECQLSDELSPNSERARVYQLLFVQNENATLSRSVERVIAAVILVATGALVIGSIPV